MTNFFLKLYLGTTVHISSKAIFFTAYFTIQIYAACYNGY